MARLPDYRIIDHLAELAEDAGLGTEFKQLLDEASGSAACCEKYDTCRERCVTLVDHLRKVNKDTETIVKELDLNALPVLRLHGGPIRLNKHRNYVAKLLRIRIDEEQEYGDI